jgi:hypothetical protein
MKAVRLLCLISLLNAIMKPLRRCEQFSVGVFDRNRLREVG